MTTQQATEILNYLAHVKKRPDNYMPTASVNETLAFFIGFEAAFRFTLGCSRDEWREAHNHVWQTRGWEAARGPWREMEERGMTAQQIVDELIEIEADSVRFVAAKQTELSMRDSASYNENVGK